jgi:hypothetical protein
VRGAAEPGDLHVRLRAQEARGRRLTKPSLATRVVSAAEAALAEQQYASFVDVLIGLGWLHPVHIDQWRKGRLAYLEQILSIGADRVDSARRIFEDWVAQRGLVPSETPYVSASRDRRPLRFTEDGDEAAERAYRTHWASPDLSEAKRTRLAERQSKPPDLVVISPLKHWACSSCGGTGAFLLMESDEPVCLTCADMDHLVFLPSGDATLSRRAKKASRLSAVVVRFSRTRKRYERQGILVEEAALEQAEASCLADEEVRARRRERAAERRADEDVTFQASMAKEITRLFPGCPPERAQAIAAHAGARGSGRIGRTADGRALDPEAVTLAVVASIRHEDTRYDDLLMTGMLRDEARARVRDEVDRVLDTWRG